MIFSTMQIAGIRVTDIFGAYRPTEVVAIVAPGANTPMDQRPDRPLVIQNCDAYVDKQGLNFANDYDGGLFILEYEG